jgi:nitrate reductase gamma subunit
MSGPLLMMLAWALLAVFVIVFTIRSVKIARLPVHLRWELAPIPKDRKRGSYGGSYLEEYEWWKKPRKESHTMELGYMLKEIVFLKALWEHNRRLWWFSYPFHTGLYVLVVAGGVLLFGAAWGAGWSGLGGALGWLAMVGNGLGALGAVGLLASRLLNAKLRRFTTPAALFNLVLLGAVFATGFVGAVRTPGYGVELLGLTRGLFTVNPPAAVGGLLAAHVVLTLVFLAYLPFGQMMHFVAKYFTYHQIRWQDNELIVGGSLEREVQEMMNQPVTWAGAHVQAGEGKTWVDIATEEVKK